jgi:hypothetical protein
MIARAVLSFGGYAVRWINEWALSHVSWPLNEPESIARTEAEFPELGWPFKQELVTLQEMAGLPQWRLRDAD